MSNSSSPRLDSALGALQFMLQPWGAPLVGLTGWAMTAPFSTSPVAIGLCWWGVTLLIWSARAERKWLEVLPFPPLTVIAVHLFLRWELGGIILLLSKQGSSSYAVWRNHVAQALPINAVFTTLLLGVPLLMNSSLLREQHTPSPAFKVEMPSESTLKRWILLASVTGFVAIGYALIGYYSGTLDRGPEYLRWAGRFWRPDTFFSATIRLRDLYFLILPFVLYSFRRSRSLIALFLIPTLLSLYLTSLLGGRGIILYPLILLIGGAWLAGSRAKAIRLVMLATIIFTVTFIPLSTAFKGTRLARSDFTGRAIEASKMQLLSRYDSSMFGATLYASSDPFLFVQPGIDQKPAGFKRFENLRYIWLPRIFGESRPEINDGHLIVNEIKETPEAGMHNGRYTTFRSITTGGDLYWRFRWPGVLAGGTVFGILYSLACRAWYNYSDLTRNTYTILLALFPATFLQGPPLRSILESIWNWLYEMPKYGIILLFIAIIIERVIRITSQQTQQNG